MICKDLPCIIYYRIAKDAAHGLGPRPAVRREAKDVRAHLRQVRRREPGVRGNRSAVPEHLPEVRQEPGRRGQRARALILSYAIFFILFWIPMALIKV